MYIEAVPNRNSPPAILLRESYREGGKVRKRTLCNLSDWPTAHIEGLRGVLKGGTVIPVEREGLPGSWAGLEYISSVRICCIRELTRSTIALVKFC